MAQLIVEEGTEPGRIYTMHGVVVIGRSDGCHVQVLDSAASAHHAELRPIPGGYEIRDLKTSNGTWVNDAQVRTARPLQGGDRIHIGRTRLLYVAELGLEAAAELAAEATAREADGRRARTRRDRRHEATPTRHRSAPTRFEGGAGGILLIAAAVAVLWALWRYLVQGG